MPVRDSTIFLLSPIEELRKNTRNIGGELSEMQGEAGLFRGEGDMPVPGELHAAYLQVPRMRLPGGAEARYCYTARKEGITNEKISDNLCRPTMEFWQSYV